MPYHTLFNHTTIDTAAGSQCKQKRDIEQVLHSSLEFGSGLVDGRIGDRPITRDGGERGEAE